MPHSRLIIDGPDGRPSFRALRDHGPSLLVHVEFTARSNGTIEVVRRVENTLAMIDTGASSDCIDEAFARSIGLPQIDEAPLGGVGGVHLAPVYIAWIEVPAVGLRFPGRLFGTRNTKAGIEHRVLLGRTFLARVVMVYDGPKGIVTLADPSSRAEVLAPALL